MKKIHYKAPIFETLIKYANKNVTSFHTPGHKSGRGVLPELKGYTGEKFFSLDVTTFPSVDSLHTPQRCIRKAQKLMADLYGVKESFFLINGSTVGNEAMFLSACSPGDSVILSRNIHKSVISAIILSGVWPIWIQPEVDQNLDIIFDNFPEKIENALINFPEAKAVFVTTPTYNGIVCDIKKISKMVHSHKKLLLVDEAWGAHLRFNDKLPPSAVDADADMVVHSIHKTLSAFSQGSVLHLDSDVVDSARVAKVVSLLQSTSPFYPILASLDLARKQMALNGERIWDRILYLSRWARNKLKRLRRLRLLENKDLSKEYYLDITKITVNVTKTGIPGYEIANILNKKYSIQVDCSDLFNIIAILGVGSNKEDLKKLVDSLEDIDIKYRANKMRFDTLALPSLSTEMVVSPRDALLGKRFKEVSLKDSIGHISAETLTPYPPGIPILIPGERISEEIVEYLEKLNLYGIEISGRKEKRIEKIKVVEL